MSQQAITELNNFANIVTGHIADRAEEALHDTRLNQYDVTFENAAQAKLFVEALSADGQKVDGREIKSVVRFDFIVIVSLYA